jgi:hypothetical protein
MKKIHWTDERRHVNLFYLQLLSGIGWGSADFHLKGGQKMLPVSRSIEIPVVREIAPVPGAALYGPSMLKFDISAYLIDRFCCSCC